MAISVIIEDQSKLEIERCWRLGNDEYLLQQSDDEFPLLSNLNLYSYDVFGSMQGESLSEELMKVANSARNPADRMHLERIAQMANLIAKKEGWTITFTPFSK